MSRTVPSEPKTRDVACINLYQSSTFVDFGPTTGTGRNVRIFLVAPSQHALYHKIRYLWLSHSVGSGIQMSMGPAKCQPRVLSHQLRKTCCKWTR